MSLFQIENLAVDVPGRRLLDGITLDLPKGQVIALIGHNGSGKSTLLKVLGASLSPTPESGSPGAGWLL